MSTTNECDYEKVDIVGRDGAPIQTIMRVNGLTCSTFERTYDEISAIIHNLKNLKFRDDDVLLCTPPKSGTHWGYEILTMLLQQKPENAKMPKLMLMLSRTSQEELDRFPSPRVINTHLPVHMLPLEELKKRNMKIFLVLRNPKDVVVSYYHHTLGIKHYQYNGTFEGFFHLFLEGKLEYNDWFDYVLGFEKIMKEGTLNIHLTYFEDMKENPLQEIKKMATFLGNGTDDSLCEAICEKCHFQNMRNDTVPPPEIAKHFFKENFSILRKGEIGQWMQEMTSEQIKLIDQRIEEKLSGSTLSFRYVPIHVNVE